MFIRRTRKYTAEVFNIYSTIIVDDEMAARKSLEKYITELSDDFYVKGIFNDGDEAIEFLKSNEVDVVFTDVKMPCVSGVELAKFIYENNIDTEVVIISGFSEFEYAQDAMKYGAVEYLLKVVSVPDFKALLAKLRGILKGKTKQMNESKRLEATIFFYDLLGGFYSDETEIRNKFDTLSSGIKFENAVCEIVTLEFINLESFMQNEWRYSADVFEDTIVNFLSMINNEDTTLLLKLKSDCFTCLILHKKGFEKISEDVLAYELKNIFGLSPNKITTQYMTITEIYKEGIPDFINIKEQERVMLSKRMDKSLENQKEIVHRVKQYIEENYQHGITRNSIAEHFSLNEDYLGRVFKNISQKTISEYLYEIRFRNAKKLFKEGYSTAVVSEKVGYNCEENFRRMFRKYVGMSVKEYKEYGMKNEK